MKKCRDEGLWHPLQYMRSLMDMSLRYEMNSLFLRCVSEDLAGSNKEPEAPNVSGRWAGPHGVLVRSAKTPQAPEIRIRTRILYT